MSIQSIEARVEKARSVVYTVSGSDGRMESNGTADEDIYALLAVVKVTKATIACDKWGTFECPNDCSRQNERVCAALAELEAME